MKRIAIAITLLLASFATAFAQDENRFAVAGLKEHEVEVFFNSFKEAVAKGDKRRVARMVSYPLVAELSSNRTVKISSPARFIKLYDRIFDDKFKQLIAQTEFKDLWANYSGVATPGGAVWINGIMKNRTDVDKYEIKITTLNGPIR